MTIKQVQLFALCLIVLCFGGAVSLLQFVPQSAFAKATSSDDILKEVANYRKWTRINAEPQEIPFSAFS